MKIPQITVITVCYNAVDGIEKTIQSVINQVYGNIEYIIIDGGSTDGTVDVVKKYEKYITKWISEPDKGIYDAMNKGIKMANGEWLNFMNAGDVFVDNDIVSKCVPYMLDSEYKIVYGNIIRIYNHYKERKFPIRKKKIDAVDFLIGNIDHQASFIKRELFDKYGLYDTSYRLGADHDFFFRVLGIYKEKCKYINLNMAFFMMDGNSTLFKEKYKEEKEAMYRKEFGGLYDYIRELSEYRASSLLQGLLAVRLLIKRTGFNAMIRKILSFRLK